MALTGAEPIMDSLKSELSTRLPAILVTLAGSLVPAIPMPDVREFNFGDVDYSELWPTITFVINDDDIEHEKVGRLNLAHEIEIRCQVIHDTPETLQRLLLRYTRAILQALLDAENAGAFTFTFNLNGKRIAYGDQRKNAQDSLEREVRIPVQCWAAEERV